MVTKQVISRCETRKCKLGGHRNQSRAFRWTLKAVAVLTIILVIWLMRGFVIDWLRFAANREAFSAYIRQFGLFGPLVLAVFNLFHVVVALLPGHVFVAAAGYIYGLFPGFLFNFSTIILASTVAFFLARWYGRPLVIRLAPAEVIDRWDKAAEQHGFAFFLTSYLLPLFPADTMNFVAGLSSISISKFLLANAIGRTPSMLLVTAIGAFGLEIAALDIPHWFWVSFLAISAAAYGGWQYYYHSKQKRRNGRKGDLQN